MKKEPIIRLLRLWALLTRGKTNYFKFFFASAFILLSGTFLFAQTAKSPDALITVNKSNAQLTEILKEIEAQSGYYFVYTQNDLPANSRVSLNVSNEKLTSALEKLLSPLQVSYVFSSNYITLKREANTQQPQVAASSSRPNTKTVTGVVTDLSGEPMIGAAIVEKGSGTNATITDINGQFSLSLPQNGTITISYLGYTDQEVSVAGKNNLTVLLAEDVKSLGELVVIGYGTQRKATLTGAVSSIGGDDLVKVQQTSLKGTMLGKLPGIKYTQTNGEPGNDGGTFNIRGFGDPLTIVDGVERPFSQIDPNEIESISVLKDASAAVYGFKGANGVIIIQTKKGNQGKPRINYNYSIGLQSPVKNFEMMNGYELAVARNQAALNANMNANLPYDAETVEGLRNGTIPTTDWYGSATRSGAPKQQHNLNINGGTENLSYFFSFGYLDQEGILKSSQSFKRYNFRSNVSAKITKRLRTEVGLGGRLEDRDYPYHLGDEGAKVFERIKTNSPIASIYANGNSNYYNRVDNNEINPMAMLDRDATGYKDKRNLEFNSQLALILDIIDGLSAKALVSFDYTDEKRKELQRIYNEYTYDEDAEDYVLYNRVAKGNLYQRTQPWYKTTQQYSLNYNKRFGAHDVAGMMLFEWRQEHTNWFSARSEYSLSTGLDELNKGDAENQTVDGNSEVKKWGGLVGRFNYGYKDRYLAEFSFRNDGSYRNSPRHRWGFFPAFSAGWRISEENFIKDNASWINNLKLRGSWGKVGNDNGLSANQFMSGWVIPSGDDRINYIFGNDGILTGISEANLANMDIFWTTIQTTNIGLDASFWRDKLMLEVDYFHRKTTGKYGKRDTQLPTSAGFELPQENLNSDEDRGFEISVGTLQRFGDLVLQIKGNVAYSRSKDLTYVGPTYLNQWLNYRNNINDRVKPEHVTWGYVAEGQFQSYEEIMKAPIHDSSGNSTLHPGDIKIKDLNGDGVIDEADMKIIGRGRYPNLNYGLTMSGTWKNFDFDLLFQGAALYTHLPEVTRNPFRGANENNNGFKMWTDNWHKADYNDPNSAWVAGKYPALRSDMGSVGKNNAVSTFWTTDAYYVRLKSIEVGYTLPKQWINRVGVENFRLYVNAYNPLTITNVKDEDPEAVGGMISFYYPQLKTWTFGINVTF